MITLEEMISGSEESSDALADAIIALMKRAYERGYERGYAEGRVRRGLLADDDLDVAFKNGQQEGYLRGKEDGYDEACMDLTGDDLGSKVNGDCDGCFGASFGDCDKCRGMASKDVPQAEKSRCMTPEEFAETMKEIAESEDPECAHGDMDDLMCQLLEDLGYEEGVKIYLDADKWYA